MYSPSLNEVLIPNLDLINYIFNCKLILYIVFMEYGNEGAMAAVSGKI